MTRFLWTSSGLAGVVLSLLLSASAHSAMPSSALLKGKVTDFDDRYVFIGAVTEQYRIKRSVVPDSVELRPGAMVSMEVPFDALKILPVTAPVLSPMSGPGMAPPMPQRPYHPPRKREPAQD